MKSGAADLTFELTRRLPAVACTELLAMIESVETLEEAEQWFMTHSSGEVLCISKDGLRQKVCDCYPVAKEFYESNAGGRDRGTQENCRTHTGLFPTACGWARDEKYEHRS